jgi:hypothetical protein
MSEKRQARPQPNAQEPGNRFEGEVESDLGGPVNTEQPPQPQTEQPPQPTDPGQQNRDEFDRLLQNNPDLPQSAQLTSPPAGTKNLAWFSATTPDKQSKLYFFNPSEASDAPPQYVPYEEALKILNPIIYQPENPDSKAALTLINRIREQRPDLSQQTQASPSAPNQIANQADELNPNDHRQAIEARKRRATEQQSTPTIPPDEFARKSPPPRASESGLQPATKIVTPTTPPLPTTPPGPQDTPPEPRPRRVG